jgi:hypothetical protein
MGFVMKTPLAPIIRYMQGQIKSPIYLVGLFFIIVADRLKHLAGFIFCHIA